MTTAQTLDVNQLQNENRELRCEIVYLQEQLDWLKRQIFGKRSERLIPSHNDQLMFDGFEEEKETKPQTQTVPAHERNKPNRNGQDSIVLPADIPVKTIVLDIPEEDKVCKETGLPLVRIGEEKTQKLAHEPGSYYIKEIIRPKYAHPKKPENGIITAFLPDSILPRCRADDSLLAEIVTRKFVDHLPLYRIAESMKRDRVIISYKLLSQWVVRVGMALKPLYELMLEKILHGENIFIDESPVKLQAKERCKTAYMWVIAGGENTSNPPYRIYDFRENRCHDNVLDILKEYQGVVHSDKYGAYQRLAERKIITWCPCWGHVRRKFFEAESGDPSFRVWMLRKIRYLFMFERVAWARSPEERLKIRRDKEVPIIEELIRRVNERLLDGKLLPKSKFREALGYFHGLSPYLKNYTKHPFSRMDNNVAERAIRPLAIGRKNWLFFGSADGGEAGAILLSLVQTCRGLEINPREYLEDIFRRLMGHSAQRLEELLPDQWLAIRKAANHAIA